MSELRRFLQKRRSKRYGACSDVAGANTLDSWLSLTKAPLEANSLLCLYQCFLNSYCTSASRFVKSIPSISQIHVNMSLLGSRSLNRSKVIRRAAF